MIRYGIKHALCVIMVSGSLVSSMFAMEDKTVSKAKPKFQLHLALLTGRVKNINSVIQEHGLDISPVNSRPGTPIREGTPDLDKIDFSPRFLPVISGSPTHETTPRKNDSPVLSIIRRTSDDKGILPVIEQKNSIDDETIN